MRSAGLSIEVVAGYHFVLNAESEEFQHLRHVLALKNKEVLDRELVTLVPADPQTVCRAGGCLLHIQQIVDTLIVDLHERTKHREVSSTATLLASLDLSKNLSDRLLG